MAVYDVKVRTGRPRWRLGGRLGRRSLVAAAVVGVLVLLALLRAQAQPLPPADCVKAGDPLLRMPELQSVGGKLTGTMVLADQLRRLPAPPACNQVYLRYFYGVNAVPAGVTPGTPVPPPSKYPDPLPGPTLRARIGELVQLTFLNQVNTLHFAGTLDRGADAKACDQTSTDYPASFNDTFPNCFHGSSSTNVHFHGTHTNPNSTGDNVFLNIRPSPLVNGQPVVDAKSVAGPFADFFKRCEAELAKSVLSEYPYLWADLGPDFTKMQETLLNAFDKGQPPYAPPAKPLPQQLWPPNQQAINDKTFPQYFVGAFPYCFRLPRYTQGVFPPVGPPATTLQMGQAPGTHWYHAHKHGSTTINVANGMTGVFIIEGEYDDALNGFYGQVGNQPWTRVQPTLVINQLGQSPNVLRAAQLGPAPFSVNGRQQPQHTMRPGEVQLWRIVNTSPGFATFFIGPPKADPSKPGVDPNVDFQWRQLAQDGVQFADPNYQKSQNISLMLASGNRVDLLVKAPPKPVPTPYLVQVQQVVSASSVPSPPSQGAATLMSVVVSGTPPDQPRQQQFIPRMPRQPVFLADITDAEVRWTEKKTLTFNSLGPGSPFQHTINGKQFDEHDKGVVVWLNQAEEWTIENSTVNTGGNTFPGGNIDHPFHIHINPFQITEVFDPNQKVVDPNTQQALPKYVTTTPTNPAVQCQLNLADKSTWRDCHNKLQRYGIWWDVFPIPAGAEFTQNGGSPVPVPGYFKMRSRFVDYPGYYVIHCHILAHEDRGMMSIVRLNRVTSPGLQHH